MAKLSQKGGKSAQSVKGVIHTNNAEYIWRWLWERIGNEYGVAGLMGNLCAESGLNPKNLQNTYERLLGMSDDEYTNLVNSGEYTEDSFVNDGAGYGLAQWTYKSRKRALYQFAVEKGKGIGDLDMQLEFLWQELGDYKTVMAILLNAQSVREASDAVLTGFEKPADQSEENKLTRAEYSMRYYELYALGPTPNEKSEEIVSLAKSKLGCEYVFGALGEYKNGKQVFDCRGFTWWLLHEVGISISTVGATTQFNTVSDWVERGLTGDMPNLVCPVFKYRKSDGKMSHTGMHIGDGVIIHCTSNGGVKYGSLTDTSWTHYAIPKGLYTDDEILRARERDTMRTLKTGCSGSDVKLLQETLNGLGYECGTADGVFGTKTRNAVIAFQKAHGLTADGVVGEKTRAALDAALNGGETDSAEPEIPVTPTGKPTMDEVLKAYRIIGQALGLDCRSETLTNIDYT